MNIFAILSVILAVFVLAGSVSAADIDANSTDIASAVDNDEIADVENDLGVSGESEGSYSDLRQEIGAGGDVNLTKGSYRYSDGDGSTIEIRDSCTINGNGAVIDMGMSGIPAFNVYAIGVTFKNLTIKNANYSQAGGAIFFMKNGAVTDCNFVSNSANSGGALYFGNNGTVTNCNFTDNSAKNGGAVHIVGTGTVTNCNFVNNTGDDGGAIRLDSGTVEDCNFTNNFNVLDSGVYYGGAIYFYKNGTVINCDFVNNSAPLGGAVCFKGKGTVTSCNFTDNSASYSGGAIRFDVGGCVINCNFINNNAIKYDGGAVYFTDNGTVENCNFTGNNATSGSAIYFSSKSANKTVSNSRFLNNRANADDRNPLQITKNEANIVITFMGQNNLLNAIYSNSDVSFSNVSYWGANGIASTSSTPTRSKNEAGQNLTVIVVVNDVIVMDDVKITDSEGKISLDLSVDSKYFIYVRHDEDSYYTQAEKIFTNMDFSVNVTGTTSNSKKVNITAKSNVKNELIEGKLSFILPNGTEIPAIYDNGTWWALCVFDDYGNYNVGASYVDGVTVNNATISISKEGVTITASDKAYVINYGGTYSAVLKDSKGNAISGERVTFTLNGKNIGYGVTDSKGVASIKLTAKILKAAKAGKKNLVIKFSGTDDYKSASKTVKITINKEKTKIVAKKKTFKAAKKVKKYTITLKNSKGKVIKKAKVTLKIKGKTYKAKTNTKGKATFKIKKLAKKGKYVATVTFKGNAYYNKVAKKTKIVVK